MREPKGSPTPPPFHVMLLVRDIPWGTLSYPCFHFGMVSSLVFLQLFIYCRNMI